MDTAEMIREAFANEHALEGAAFAAMPGPAVKVKPLEWEWVVGDVEVAGPYKLDRMRPWRSGKPKKYWVQVALGSGFRTIATLLPSLEAAKAAAQADYEARVLSALTPAPDPQAENERLRAALEVIVKGDVLAYDEELHCDVTVSMSEDEMRDIAKAALGRT